MLPRTDKDLYWQSKEVGMNRRILGVGAVLTAVVLLSVAPLPVAAHTNTIEAVPQVSPDGTVVAESVFVFEDTWLVVHRDDGGEIGEPIGHRAVPTNSLETEVPVDIDADVWESWEGSRSVHLALHHDDGDGEFSPADDPILGTEETTAATRIVVERGDARAYVHAARIDPLETSGNVSVRAAVMPTDGYLVAHPVSDSGQVVGAIPLEAGDHDSTSIRLDETFYRQQDRQFEITVAIYRDDGDGTLGDGDTPVLAGDESVATTVTLERTDDRTPTPTTAEGDGHDHEHDDENESHTHGPDTDSVTESTPTQTTGDDGAGPGPLLVLLAVAAAALLARTRAG